jgi:hypothetical protein
VGGCGRWGVIVDAGMTAAVANALGTRGAGHKGKVDYESYLCAPWDWLPSFSAVESRECCGRGPPEAGARH